MFEHLREQHMGYWQHLVGAWRMALVLLVHGVIPSVWTTWVSDRICADPPPRP